MDEYFGGIYGQHKTVKTLKNIYSSGKVPHAFLFTGERGVGKFYTALQFIKLLNKGISEKALKQISSLSEPYVKLIVPLSKTAEKAVDPSAGASKGKSEELDKFRDEINKRVVNPYYQVDYPKNPLITIDRIREINKFISFSYDDIKYRVVLIDDAHLMNTEAQNALLKNLEEPPDGIIFILITPDINRLLPTISSRVWTVRFAPLSPDHIKTILSEYYKIPLEDSIRIAPFSAGSLSVALSMLNYNFNEIIEKTVEFLRFSLVRRFTTAKNVFETTFQDDNTKTKLFLYLVYYWFYIAYTGEKRKENLERTDEFYETALKFSKRYPKANITGMLDSIDKFRTNLDKNVSLNILIMNIIFEIGALLDN